MVRQQVSIWWGDETKRFAVCCIENWQDWEQLSSCLNAYLEFTRGRSTSPMLVYVFEDNVTAPEPWSLPHLHTFMRLNQTFHHQTVLVNAPRILKVFVPMVQQVYGDLAVAENDYLFVDTLAQVQHYLPSGR